jgi:ubiquinone/menaquinone biosynthesis C-methylase UbiE
MVETTRGNGAPKKKADYYDDPGYNYQEYWEGREYEHAAEEMALDRLLEGKHFHHAVDLGGGYGRLSVLLTKYADKVTLAEPSAQQLELAHEYLADYPQIERLLMQADAMTFADASVDLLTFIRVMHHIPDPRPELKEIARVLSEDGYAIIEAANYNHGRHRLSHLIHHKKMPLQPIDIRSDAHRHSDEVPFVNHNPKTVIKQLAHAGLKVERILSVSNLRSRGLKKIMPKRVMLAIEGILQPTLAHGYFGPSVFFLVKRDK